jgi:methionyl-tRNA synthetase
MSSDPASRFYVTTPIYYVNARPHIGHAYTTIVADVLARRHRLLGEDTLFLTGTDEHGQKIERSAAAAGVEPQQFADQVSAEFRKLWDRMGLTYDRYIRTTDPAHKRGAQMLFADLHRRGQIYLSSYTGQYSIGEEMFVDGPPGTIGPDGKPTETVTEENFFFRLSAYQERLIDLISSNELRITPEASRNEVLRFLCGDVSAAGANIRSSAGTGVPFVPGALRDLSVSRSSFTWGIPVPEPAASESAQKHVIYVWLDALANYMTAVGYGGGSPQDAADFARWWPADVHLVGKEITRFHCVYWPAFLLAANLPLPKAITAHGWLLFDNSKMSKSRGNIVRTETILDAFGDHVYGKQFPESSKQERDLYAADVLRYFLLREIPFGQDGSFSFDALVTRYNADLANGYANLVSRSLTMIGKSFGGAFQQELAEQAARGAELAEQTESFSAARETLSKTIREAPEYFGCNDFANLLASVSASITSVDKFFSDEKPWKLAASGSPEDRLRLSEILCLTCDSVRIITALLYPFLPTATGKVWAQLGLGDIAVAARNGELNDLTWGGVRPGARLGPLAPIFPRADKGLVQIMNDMENPPSPAASSQTPAQAASTDPAAGPRTSSLSELGQPGGALTVGGSNALSTGPHGEPAAHKSAHASAPFDTTAAQMPITAGPADGSPQITIDDFAKVELRVGQVVVAERIPKADKLLRLDVDLGYERRQILSGIAEWYTPEDLIGRRIVVIANLAPRKMRGLDSHGMLLAASNGEGGKPILATMADEIALGSRLK